MKVHDVLSCSFPAWYDKFKKCSIKSLVIPLTPEVLAYLQDDGTLVLPEGSQPELTYQRETDPEDAAEDWDHCELSGSVVQGPRLDDFSNKIKDAINNLGGSAFPKLNWSAPKDASWIAFNNCLRCCTPGDVFLLLKSSSFITHDLIAPFKDCDDPSEARSPIDYCLVLRKWMDINPAFEFRCFVRSKELVGICQRDVSQSYSCIGGDRTNILGDITSFWRENIENRFPLQDYVFDVYRPAKDHVILVDFNPFGEMTDGLLFSWSELLESESRGQGLSRIIEDEMSQMRLEGVENSLTHHHNERNIMDSNRHHHTPPRDTAPEFRFIADATGVQPSPYMQYGLPVDIIDLSTGQDPQKLIDFLQMKIQTEDDDSSEDEVPS